MLGGDGVREGSDNDNEFEGWKLFLIIGVVFFVSCYLSQL